MSGVGSGIGAATARRCIELGACVVGFDITPVPSFDEGLTSLVVDVSRQEEGSRAFTQALDHLGRLDAVVNIAGIGHTGTITDVSPQDFARVMAVNVEGTFVKYPSPQGRGLSLTGPQASCNHRRLDGSPGDIDRRVHIGIHTPAPALAAKGGLALAIGFLAVSTLRTRAAGVAWVYQDQTHASPGCLVGEKLPQLIEGPGMPLIALCPSNRSSLPNAGQVFQRECLAGRSGFLHERLADAVVGIGLEAPFSPAVLLQAALSRLRADLLQCLAALVVTLARLPDGFTREGLPLAIGCQVDDAQVYAQVLPIIAPQSRCFLALGHMQEVDATPPNQISPANLPGRVNQHGVLTWAKHQPTD